SRALQTGDPEDLTGPQLEIDAVELFVAACGDGENGRTDLGVGLGVREERADRPAHHGPDEAGMVEFGSRSASDQGTVLEHGDHVAEVEDLLQPMGDVDDGRSEEHTS